MKQIVSDIVFNPWPWWVGGPLIGLFVIALLLLERKQLGISSSYQFICAKVSPFKLDYFKSTKKSQWQFWFVTGMVLGGLLISLLLEEAHVSVSTSTVETLNGIGVTDLEGYVPSQLYNTSTGSLVILLIGGLFIGFGARYANGCTAGHAIMGCAQLSVSSIIATVCFFIGGIIATYLIIPNLF
jgi:uncharacterized membrane protein YedE/YeeE